MLDVDECDVTENMVCGPNADCNNKVPGFTCNCHQGYQHLSSIFTCEGNRTCMTAAVLLLVITDIDECLTGEHNCDTCENINGSFKCSCKPGFTGAGVMGSCTGMI